ncbi:MAG: GTPase ObgE [Minisyncoccia bacterium]
MLIDEITIKAMGGRGGDGVVRWRHEKYIDKGGPNGGNGGKGGDVYVRGVRDVTLLAKYKSLREFSAKDAEPGMGGSKQGSDGDDIYIDIPIGSTIENLRTGYAFELKHEGQEVMIVTGGAGGMGNEHFKSSINVAPEKATRGKAGEEAEFKITLELIADIGLVGLPNAGKSSLLNSITNAQAKIGSYAFTTLDPNLGAYHGYVIADIPGLIEGASAGKGLGHKFLRHIKRTHMLVHLVSFEHANSEENNSGQDGTTHVASIEEMLNAYNIIRKELENYDKALSDKKEIILLTKTDVILAQNDDKNIIEKTIESFKTVTGKPVYAISLYDDESIKSFSDSLVAKLREEEVEE